MKRDFSCLFFRSRTCQSFELPLRGVRCTKSNWPENQHEKPAAKSCKITDGRGADVQVLHGHRVASGASDCELCLPMWGAPPHGVMVALAGADCARTIAQRHNVSSHMYPEVEELLPLLLGHARHGTFLEIGAYDGVTSSTTWILEACYGWRGALVEPQLSNFEALSSGARTAVKVHAAGCPTGESVNMSTTGTQLDTIETDGFPQMMLENYYRLKEQLGPADVHRYAAVRRSARARVMQVPCRSLNDVMADAGMRHLDFLSVDVQGMEADVLATISLAAVSVVLVEAEGDSLHDRHRQESVRAILTSNGFVQHPLFFPATWGPKPTRRKRAGTNGFNELFLKAPITDTRPSQLFDRRSLNRSVPIAVHSEWSEEWLPLLPAEHRTPYAKAMVDTWAAVHAISYECGLGRGGLNLPQFGVASPPGFDCNRCPSGCPPFFEAATGGRRGKPSSLQPNGSATQEFS